MIVVVCIHSSFTLFSSFLHEIPHLCCCMCLTCKIWKEKEDDKASYYRYHCFLKNEKAKYNSRGFFWYVAWRELDSFSLSGFKISCIFSAYYIQPFLQEAHSPYPFIRVPKVHRHLSQRRVLTMEWMVGENPRDLLFKSTEPVDRTSGYKVRLQNEAKRKLLDLVGWTASFMLFLNRIRLLYLAVRTIKHYSSTTEVFKLKTLHKKDNRNSIFSWCVYGIWRSACEIHCAQIILYVVLSVWWDISFESCNHLLVCSVSYPIILDAYSHELSVTLILSRDLVL